MRSVPTYVVAVSGGVDSAALLYMLVGGDWPAGSEERCEGFAGTRLVVAHFDHGIRPGSDADARFVRGLAATYGLPCETGSGNLGAGAGESAARTARYGFLEDVRGKYGATAILTAHQQDDVLETVLLNLRRGTGRRGLSSLRDTTKLRRPLLNVPKTAIYDYAVMHGLEWVEDPTNPSDAYRRNRIRHHELPRLGPAGRRRLLDIWQTACRQNDSIDAGLANLLDGSLHASRADLLDRDSFRDLPPEVRPELLAAWLRRHGIRDYDRPSLLRLTEAVLAYATGKQADVRGPYVLYAGRRTVRLGRRATSGDSLGNTVPLAYTGPTYGQEIVRFEQP